MLEPGRTYPRFMPGLIGMLGLLCLGYGPVGSQTLNWVPHVFPDPYQQVVPQRMTQVRNGLIWLGTNKGLFAYDGQDFQEWARPDRPQDRLAVTALFEDPDGTLWVGYEDGGIAFWRDRYSGLTLWQPQ